ncbi:MAG: Sec-independent protein translocase protein TatB [Actinomycetota bacterium]
MPQIGPFEILMVAAIALIVFGPQRLPEIARAVGKGLAEMRRMATDLRDEFEAGLEVDDEDDSGEPPEAPVSHPLARATGESTALEEGDGAARPEAPAEVEGPPDAAR